MNFVKTVILGSVRFIIQIIFFVVERITDFVDALAFKFITVFQPPEYIRKGACKSSGTCCKQIGLSLPWSWVKRPGIVALVRKWHFLRYNFEPLGMVDNMLVYKCLYLKEDNKCPIHRYKPKLCREFPARKLIGKVDLYKGCGFYYVTRKAEKFEAVLQNKKR
ncbi:YkgJ family cysteine cluster protein [bacterium]|nr:YkgJ family cysteine cluster protein [bacterium]